jgi:hypothetical protein
MEDELLAASQTLLRQGLPGAVPKELDDEHRFIPLGVDINEDVAATAFLRWLPSGTPAGGPSLQTSEFHQRDGNWVYLGGGVAHFREYPLADRRPAARQRSYLRVSSYGQTCRDEPHRFGWGARYVRHAVLKAAAEVLWLQVGAQLRDVPFHGYALVVWATRRGPSVIALAADGSPLASLQPSRDPFEIRHRQLPPR